MSAPTFGGVKRGTKKSASTRRKLESWPLIAIDSKPIRKQARSEYERVLRDLNQARGDLERHEARDKPEYLRWLHGNFGSLLTEMRDLHQQLASQRSLLFEIETEAFFSGVSMAEAYRLVMERMERAKSGADEPEDDEFFGSGQQGKSGADSDEESNRGDPFEDLFGDLFDEERSESEGKRKRGRRKAADAGPSAPSSNRISGRVKELYRALARRLHPDTQRDMTAQKLEWWHQAQVAYQSGDAEQLEVILSLCELAEKGAAAETSVSLLKRITGQFRASLRSLKKQLVKCKRDPAWDFTKRNDHKRLSSQTEATLKDELYQLKRVVKEFEWQLGRIAKEAERLSRRRPHRARARRTPSFEDLF